MTMTRRHFEAIAARISARFRNAEYAARDASSYRHALQDLTSDLADICAQENPAFNRERFLKACGISRD